ncbi:class I SAM-dependent methyltransferase [Terriglobus albidus]|uniref:class I SAM-dependent methyltransferase n=1 Tax=Terriglobus albidus TaxID=1592106 RepID=UPI0021DFED94|nr:class I SAM-dependent methyltransferase [Terriglobus albidus]
MNATPNFDRIARLYRWMEWLSFGPLLHRTRTAWLRELFEVRRALILGDGDGRFTRDLLRTNRQVHVHAVDLSAVMLQELRRRCRPYTDRLVITQDNALNFVPDASYDLVATHFFLDCLSEAEVEQLVQTLLPSLTDNARWLVSDFHIPQQGAMRPIAALLTRILYAAFRLLTGLRANHLPDHTSVLQRAGMVCIRRCVFLGGILISELWQRP